jgi:hypothetical protein
VGFASGSSTGRARTGTRRCRRPRSRGVLAGLGLPLAELEATVDRDQHALREILGGGHAGLAEHRPPGAPKASYVCRCIPLAALMRTHTPGRRIEEGQTFRHLLRLSGETSNESGWA